MFELLLCCSSYKDENPEDGSVNCRIDLNNITLQNIILELHGSCIVAGEKNIFNIQRNIFHSVEILYVHVFFFRI